MSLKDQVERLTERVNPEPPEMLTVVLRRFAPIEDPEAIQPPQYCVGRYGVAMFLGGTPRQRWREVRRLRKSGEYDTPLGSPEAANDREISETAQGTPKAIVEQRPSGGDGKAGTEEYPDFE